MRVNWGTGVTAVYGVFAACTIGFVVFAMRQPVQLVSDDYYADALGHDAHAAAIANAVGLPDSTLQVDAGAAVLTVTLPSAGSEITGTLQLYRPSDASADRIVPLALGVERSQRIPLDGLQPGRWIARLQWDSGGRHFYRELPMRLR